MSTAKPMSSVRRSMVYMNQNGGDNSMGLVPYTAPDRLTPAQTRRLNHKANRLLGEAGSGTVKPRQVKTRQTRPAPVAGGLLRLLNPKQLRQKVADRAASRNVKWSAQAQRGMRPDIMIIDDPVRYPIGNGDR